MRSTGAIIMWGIDNPEEIEGYTKGVKYLESFYLTDRKIIQILPQKYRTMFKLAGLFKSAREAHRVLVVKSYDS